MQSDSDKEIKLHLGCGQRYLSGYVNIDLPNAYHTVQQGSAPDFQLDILSLRYQPESVAEIRLHHLFEHFTRPVACALLASWFSWLKREGILHIEVPDFEKTARVLLSPFTSLRRKAVAERHLFGSHEAGWAVHCEGYTRQMLNKMLEMFGFRVQRISKNSWLGTYNFEIVAVKSVMNISRAEFEKITKRYLLNYLVDHKSETELLDLWMRSYKRQVERSWAAT